jgi:hypothetical protein
VFLRRRLSVFVCTAAVIVASTLLTPLSPLVSPAGADGPAPCSAGAPPFAFRGFCATYSGHNTFYGSYGPGFPTPLGWALCAFRAGGGGSYPAPGYGYVLTGPPSGVDTSALDPLGYAFSRADAEGFWNGIPGRFTADQAAVAAKLLYDAVAWHMSVPTMDPGVSDAYVTLFGWELTAIGATGAPNITVALAGGGTTFTTTGTISISVWFPGSNRGVSAAGVILGLTNATFTATGSTTGALITDTNGAGSLGITATGTGPVTVTVEAAARVGQPGLLFYRPTQHVVDAQTIVAGFAPATAYRSATFTSLAPPPATGTISVAKSGDDTAYWPIDGAIFNVMAGSTVVDSLVIRSNGTSAPSGPLLPGTYVVKEIAAPPGYVPAPDQQVIAVTGRNTVVSFTGPAGDHVIPATLTLRKVSATSGAPLAGAVLDVRFDPSNTGAFTSDLGTCTTDATGTCVPGGNDGSSLLPGRYSVTEVAPPPGYALDPHGPVVIMLGPGQTGLVRFADPPLVPQRFTKEATGNVNPSTVLLNGAVISVRDSLDHLVATCTTGANGSCSTPSVLVDGARYCWEEIEAPPGLAAGANGCFTASTTGSAVPIVVSDPGLYVEVVARKVSTADPTLGIPGAVFDFYRMDAGSGPTHPTPAPGATVLAGATWVDRSTSGADGLAPSGLQLPGYAYCIIEHVAPPGYALNSSTVCTGVLQGVASQPPTTATLNVADVETTTSLSVTKTNTSQPGTGVPGARYDLYVRVPAPASTPATPDPAAPVVPGLRWYASGLTSATGHLTFAIPIGYQWCVKERSTPSDFILDPGLHCTGTIDAQSGDSVRTIAVGENPALLEITGFKFNASRPGEVIPGASYALFVDGPMPVGFAGPTPPAGMTIPAGMELFATSTTDASGIVRFAVPSGSRWCLQELRSPAGYELDPGLHCTGVLTAGTTATATRIALPEVGVLALTGGTMPLALGVGLLSLGVVLLIIGRRRPRSPRGRTGVDGMITR